MTQHPEQPLVTIGVPTFNRPVGLARTLDRMIGQSYPNLEIIISDNCSDAIGVSEVCREYSRRDSRVTYVLQDENRGPFWNFGFLLERSRGTYFMWAADDDDWELNFVELCLKKHLGSKNALAMVQMEVQYMTTEGELLPFFAEGKAFYTSPKEDSLSRLGHMITNVYGNLFYGLFRRSALSHQDLSVTHLVGASLNELPMLLLIAFNGGISVLPEIGMYKSVRRTSYDQARWEKVGGRLRCAVGETDALQRAMVLTRYHYVVLQEASTVIASLPISRNKSGYLIFLLTAALCRHLLHLVLRWKPRR